MSKCAQCNSGYLLSADKTTCSKCDHGNSLCRGSCTFDDATFGQCSWWSNSTTQVRWQRGSTTPSVGTGPTQAANGTHFMFLEVSAGSVGNVAYLTSNVNVPSMGANISFYYHMHGATMGSLSVEVYTSKSQQWLSLWTQTGQQHAVQTASWSFVVLALPDYTTAVRFKGTKGTSFTGDAAVDSITVTQVPPAPLSCVPVVIGTKVPVAGTFNGLAVPTGTVAPTAGTFCFAAPVAVAGPDKCTRVSAACCVDGVPPDYACGPNQRADGTCDVVGNSQNYSCVLQASYATITAACPTEVAACEAKSVACQPRLNETILLQVDGQNVAWEKEEEVIQAVFLCANTVGEMGPDPCVNITKVGRLSRSLLGQYCPKQVAAGRRLCPAAEHHHCCSCYSAAFPVQSDDGHCCADCLDTCTNASSALSAGDRCSGVYPGKCNAMQLVEAVLAMVTMEAANNMSQAKANALDMQSFCACRAVVRKLALQDKNVTGDECAVTSGQPSAAALQALQQSCAIQFQVCQNNATCMAELSAALHTSTVPVSSGISPELAATMACCMSAPQCRAIVTLQTANNTAIAATIPGAAANNPAQPPSNLPSGNTLGQPPSNLPPGNNLG